VWPLISLPSSEDTQQHRGARPTHNVRLREDDGGEDVEPGHHHLYIVVAAAVRPVLLLSPKTGRPPRRPCDDLDSASKVSEAEAEVRLAGSGQAI